MAIRRSFLYALTGQLMQLEEQLKVKPVSKWDLKGLISLAHSLKHNDVVKFLEERGHEFLKQDEKMDTIYERFENGQLPE